MHDDRTGSLFDDALVEPATAGVPVRGLYDWVGALRATPRSFWYRLEDAGAEVRAFNPPSSWRPLAWLSRDHRKMLAVDGRGLGLGPVRGRRLGGHGRYARLARHRRREPLPPRELPARDSLPRCGDVALRVIGSSPATASMLRLDVLVAGLARRRLWITDAYFVGVPGYVQALTADAADGVDVRLLVPDASDLPLVRSFTRAGYHGLPEGGVRVFEWNGPTVHAKSAVADDHWARVGSRTSKCRSGWATGSSTAPSRIPASPPTWRGCSSVT